MSQIQEEKKTEGRKDSEKDKRMGLPPSSSFSFTAPFPTTSNANNQATIKQRRVSLALPSSPKLFPAWSFRDDTAVDSHVASSSAPVPEKKGKMRRITMDSDKPSDKAPPPTEKRQRKKWTEEETKMLVDGCNTWGVGNWKAILNDPNLKFDNRSPVDLKDRFRTFFPDAYKQHYPNAKTHLSSKIRSTLPDGTSLFEKTRSKKRRPFTAEEDQALKAGYEKYGTVWSIIVKDPIFQEQKRRSTDLRDRFRNAFPQLYQAAGYKPRSIPKKKRGDITSPPVRTSLDDQFVPSRMKSPVRRRRARTNPGHTYSYSVPQSAACSEDEDSSDDDDLLDTSAPNVAPVEFRESTPQADELLYPPGSPLPEVTMHTIDPLADFMPDFMPDNSHSLSDITDHSHAWSSGQHSPPQIDSCWSSAPTTTTSPTSSQLSNMDYFMRDSPFARRDGAHMIGKSAWGPSDWMSANPRLEPSAASSSSSSYFGGPSPTPSSPFSFSQLSHGIMDRYDLFQNPMVHDFASELAPSDSLSMFSDPELFPTQSMRGFTHHSNTAGDLMVGTRPYHHNPSPGHVSLMNNSGMGASGLGLSGMNQPATGINPMQLHTPSLPGIDELELTSIRLDDTEVDEVMVTTAEAGVQKDDNDAAILPYGADLSSLIHLPPQTLEEIVGLSSTSDISIQMDQDAAATPPATPAHMMRSSRELQNTHQYSSSLHSRSMSVPPFEHRPSPSRPLQQQGHATPQPLPSRSLSLFDIPPTDTEPSLATASLNTASFAASASSFNDQLRAFGDSLRSLGDFYDLPFLDLHYYGSGAGSGGMSPQHHDIIDSNVVDDLRTGLALDLAHSQHSHGATSSSAHPPGATSSPACAAPSHSVNISSMPPPAGPTSPFGALSHSTASSPSRTGSYHHRGQSAVSPKELLLQRSSDNKRKRASWDGGAA